jgi:hypothetical protein
MSLMELARQLEMSPSGVGFSVERGEKLLAVDTGAVQENTGAVHKQTGNLDSKSPIIVFRMQ